MKGCEKPIMYSNKENKGMAYCWSTQRAFDSAWKVPESWVLVFGINSGIRYSNADFEQYKEFQSIRHDNWFMPDGS